MIDKDAIIERLTQENRQLRATVALLNSQVEEIREQIAKLKKNSRNSSKPPSSDIVKPPKPEPKEGGRKQGDQVGHPKIHYMAFPDEVVNAGFFMERITALVAYLKYVCHASFSSIRKFIRDVLGCDYFSSYRSYLQRFDATIQFCIAHLIRDIRFLTTLPDPESQGYGHRLLDAVRELFKVIHHREAFSARSFREALESAKQQILHAATTEIPSCLDKDGKELKRHAQNMADRFRKHGEAYFTFITPPGVDPTNNSAEQAIRFIVIDRLVTQGTRSLEGRTTCERLWTVIATCQLQGRSAFDFILKAVHAYYRRQPCPSLLLSPT